MKIKVFFLSAIAALFMSSCINIQEEITLDKNGKGKYSFTMDLSQVLTFMELEDLFKGLEDQAGDDFLSSTENEKYATEPDNFDFFSDISNKMDTVISFADITTGNTDILEKGKFRMQVDKELGQYFMTVEVDFDHVSEINDFFVAINEGNTDSPFASLMQQQSFNQDFFNWSKRKLTRNKPSNDITREEIKPEDLEMARVLFSGAKYTTIYHLPGKVKSTTIPNAEINGKSVTIENNLIDMVSGEVNIFGQIKFKKK